MSTAEISTQHAKHKLLGLNRIQPKYGNVR